MKEDDNLKIKNKFINEIRKNKNNFAKSCAAVNRDRKTMLKWLDEDDDFNTIYKETTEIVLDDAEEQLNILAGLGDIKAIKFLLCTKGRARGYDTRILLESFLTLKDTTKPKDIDLELLDKNDVLRLRDIIQKSKKDA